MKYIQKKIVSELPKATGSISDTLNVEDKSRNAPSINLVSQMAGVPTDGVIEFRGDEIPEGYEEVEASSGGIDITAIVDLLYPVGRGFLDFTGTDYSNWLGLTWERELVGMFPVGYNPNDTNFDSIGEKGGEKTHTLTINEMPSHEHSYYYNWDGSQAIGGTWKTRMINTEYGGAGTWPSNSDTLPSVAFTGGSQPHNNLPPYQVVSYWKRVAPKTMISFSMYGITYQAEEGMTFGEWVASEYNTDGWEIYTPSSGYITNDTIKSGVTLYLYSASDYYGSGYTNASHLIIADYSYSCYQEK